MPEEKYMRRALELATEAGEAGEAPVGCVIVKDGKIVAEGENRRERDGNAIGHAELIAIDAACRVLGSWRLSGCEMYVTLEPCPMCAGAIINARIDTLVFGARDGKGGAAGGVIDLFYERFNHRPKVYPGLLESECSALLQDFFRTLRGE
ncbi:MAG: nucleoside deaminase [Oscillospiraceae bacterium]|nr:nucleoside deaminase [Oscillospiraceae bacterium]